MCVCVSLSGRFREKARKSVSGRERESRWMRRENLFLLRPSPHLIGECTVITACLSPPATDTQNTKSDDTERPLYLQTLTSFSQARKD